MLLEMEGYFLKAGHPSYCGKMLASFELLMFSINQVQLKEKVRGEIALEQLKAQIRTLPELKDVPDNNFFVKLRSFTLYFCFLD
jgi:hypothetical protein